MISSSQKSLCWIQPYPVPVRIFSLKSKKRQLRQIGTHFFACWMRLFVCPLIRGVMWKFSILSLTFFWYSVSTFLPLSQVSQDPKPFSWAWRKLVWALKNDCILSWKTLGIQIQLDKFGTMLNTTESSPWEKLFFPENSHVSVAYNVWSSETIARNLNCFSFWTSWKSSFPSPSLGRQQSGHQDRPPEKKETETEKASKCQTSAQTFEQKHFPRSRQRPLGKVLPQVLKTVAVAAVHGTVNYLLQLTKYMSLKQFQSWISMFQFFPPSLKDEISNLFCPHFRLFNNKK